MSLIVQQTQVVVVVNAPEAQQLQVTRDQRVAVATQLVQGPAGAGGGAVYIHTQSSASAIWTINHNLGFYPAVELLDSGRREFEAEVIHISINQCVVYLVAPATGTARCN